MATGDAFEVYEFAVWKLLESPPFVSAIDLLHETKRSEDEALPDGPIPFYEGLHQLFKSFDRREAKLIVELCKGILPEDFPEGFDPRILFALLLQLCLIEGIKSTAWLYPFSPSPSRGPAPVAK